MDLILTCDVEPTVTAPTYREITAADHPFLVEMAALFRQGPDSASVRPWGEPEDFGFIAEEDGERIAAGWYRRHRRADGAESASGFREVYIEVSPDRQGRGIGTELWNRLLSHGRDDSDVVYLVGHPTPDSARWSVPLLDASGFKPIRGFETTWRLWVGEGELPAHVT
jgi:GNAT superfamily N-acetyltransferase